MFGVCVAGCLSRKGPTEADMRGWFESSTGLDLPEGTDIISGKVFTLIFPGLDTYYIKMKVSPEFKTFLDQHFEETKWPRAEGHLTPPTDWQDEMPFWHLDEIRGKSYYEKSVYEDGDVDKGGFTSTLSYDEHTGTVYFVGEQTWGGV